MMNVSHKCVRLFLCLLMVQMYGTVKMLDSPTNTNSNKARPTSTGRSTLSATPDTKCLRVKKRRSDRADEDDSDEKSVKKSSKKELSEDSDVLDPKNRTLHLTGRTFADLVPALHKSTMAALRALGFRHTAPVQQAVIPLLLTHKDVVVEAATGSGKTISFLVPAFELPLRAAAANAAAAGGGDSEAAAVWPRDRVGAIIIAPTRELASQICSVAAVLARHCGMPTGLLVGGGNETASLLALRGASGGAGCAVLVATPGRLENALSPERRRGGAAAAAEGVDARGLELLVLDEADRLLEMGERSGRAAHRQQPPGGPLPQGWNRGGWTGQLVT